MKRSLGQTLSKMDRPLGLVVAGLAGCVWFVGRQVNGFEWVRWLNCARFGCLLATSFRLHQFFVGLGKFGPLALDWPLNLERAGTRALVSHRCSECCLRVCVSAPQKMGSHKGTMYGDGMRSVGHCPFSFALSLSKLAATLSLFARKCAPETIWVVAGATYVR